MSATENKDRADDCDRPAAGGREETRHAVQDQQPPQILPQHHHAGECVRGYSPCTHQDIYTRLTCDFVNNFSLVGIRFLERVLYLTEKLVKFLPSYMSVINIDVPQVSQ